MHVIEEGILTQLCCKIHMHTHELSLTRSTQWLVVFYTTFLFTAVMVVGRVHCGGGVAVPEPVHAACALRPCRKLSSKPASSGSRCLPASLSWFLSCFLARCGCSSPQFAFSASLLLECLSSGHGIPKYGVAS
jgi:hypothetical protein